MVVKSGVARNFNLNFDTPPIPPGYAPGSQILICLKKIKYLLFKIDENYKALAIELNKKL